MFHGVFVTNIGVIIIFTIMSTHLTWRHYIKYIDLAPMSDG